jgi:hypothetical protein
MHDDDDGGSLITDEAPAFDPSTIRDPLPQPLISVRRVLIALVLVACAGALLWAGRDGGTPEDTVSGSTAIVRYQPTPGSRVLRQSEVGVELEPGYDGRLTIDGVAIPEDQMSGAIDPSSAEFQELPAEVQAQGPRPDNIKNMVMFQPGPGKAITEYDTGTVEITVRFWRIADGPALAETTTYTIRVF